MVASEGYDVEKIQRVPQQRAGAVANDQ